MGLFAKRRQEKARAELQAAYAGFRKQSVAERLHLAEPDIRAASARARTVLGDSDALALNLWQLHASALGHAGRGEEAQREFLAVAEAAVPGASTKLVRLLALTSRSAELCALERYEEAETQAAMVIATSTTVPHPGDEFARLSGQNNRVRALIGLGRADEAEALARTALAEGRSSSEDNGYFLRFLNVNLASALNAQGRHTEALEVLSEAEQEQDRTNVQATISAIAMVRATALLGLHRNAEAAATARSGLTAALSAFGETHTRVRELRELLARAGAGSV